MRLIDFIEKLLIEYKIYENKITSLWELQILYQRLNKSSIYSRSTYAQG